MTTKPRRASRQEIDDAAASIAFAMVDNTARDDLTTLLTHIMYLEAREGWLTGTIQEICSFVGQMTHEADAFDPAADEEKRG